MKDFKAKLPFITKFSLNQPVSFQIILANHGITVYRGCSGDVEQLVKQFVSG